MAMQQMKPTTSESPIAGAEMLAWRRFLRSHCAILRQLDADLRVAHDMTLNDYDALIQLDNAPKGAMKMSMLADSILLTRSGITRLVEGLVKTKMVKKISCEDDGRVSYAKLTRKGRRIIAEARETHHRGIRRAFLDVLSEDEIETLSTILGKIPYADTPPGCCNG